METIAQKFKGLMEKALAQANEFLSNPQEYIALSKSASNSQSKENLEPYPNPERDDQGEMPNQMDMQQGQGRYEMQSKGRKDTEDSVGKLVMSNIQRVRQSKVASTEIIISELFDDSKDSEFGACFDMYDAIVKDYLEGIGGSVFELLDAKWLLDKGALEFVSSKEISENDEEDTMDSESSGGEFRDELDDMQTTFLNAAIMEQTKVEFLGIEGLERVMCMINSQLIVRVKLRKGLEILFLSKDSRTPMHRKKDKSSLLPQTWPVNGQKTKYKGVLDSYIGTFTLKFEGSYNSKRKTEARNSICCQFGNSKIRREIMQSLEEPWRISNEQRAFAEENGKRKDDSLENQLDFLETRRHLDWIVDLVGAIGIVLSQYSVHALNAVQSHQANYNYVPMRVKEG
eukprot:Gb_41371 [translate_table: standard]